MKYKYLEYFAREIEIPGLFYRTVRRWRDQYALVFNGEKYLQVNLMQQDPFCFFTERDLIEWGAAPELAMMEQHLSRARLEKVSISEQDRIIYLDFSKPDPFQQKQEFRLILELIPQFGNIILTRRDGNRLMIIDCAKKIALAENRYRQLLPAAEYEAPPAGFINQQEEIRFPLGFDAGMDVVDNSTAGYEKVNDLLEALYYEGWLQKLSDQNLRDHRKKLNNEKKKKTDKLVKLQAELNDAERETKWLQTGELLKANQQLIKPGSKEITLVNYFDAEMKDVSISLQEDKSAQWNINNYFKKYRKAKTGKTKIAEQIAKTKEEITELEQKVSCLAKINLLLPGQKVQAVSGKNPVMESISRLKVNEEWEFLIGRNSTENDLITTLIARPDDWWFHTRIYKGTHVVLRNLKKKELPEYLLVIGCRLAAYFSKAGKSGNVPVDYTQIRYVRKPRGSAPGYVVYINQKTLYIDPLSLRQARQEVAKWQK